jgi:hypothetical protein
MKIMKTEEVLWLYELGERNFRRQNLRGKSFKGEDLSEADFSGSDIRGADFTDAILKQTNFTNVKAGLQKRQATVLLIVLLLVSALLGTLTGYIGAWVELNFHMDGLEEAAIQWVTVTVILGFSVVSLTNGIAMGFSVFVIAFSMAGAVAVASSAGVPVAGKIALALTIDSLVAVTTAAAGVIGLAATLAFRWVVAATVIAAFLVTFGLAIVVTSTAPTETRTAAIAVATTVMALSAYIGYRAMRGDRRHILTWVAANTIAAKWGTSFRGADLTSADFNRATLKSTDFSGATLFNTHWGENVGARISAKF